MEQSFAVWITGLPASGKSTIRARLVEELRGRGVDVAVLESDAVREVLDGSYDEPGRERFYRSLVWIGALLTRHGVPVVFDATANRRTYRERGRGEIPRFMEVFVDTPLEICMARDPKGIYRRGLHERGGSVPGIQADYEVPEHADVRIAGASADPEAAAREIVARIKDKGFI